MTPFEQLIVGNAAGTAKTLADVERLCKSAVTRITVGSITMHERAGNEPVPPGGVYFYDPRTGESGNALGLLNAGLQKYLSVLPEMVRMAHAVGKKLWASIVGETFAEIIELASACIACGVDGVEINLACPNVHDGGVQKPLICDDTALVEEILRRLTRVRFAAHDFGVKIAPTQDTELLVDLCRVFNACPMVNEVVACNTLGGQRFTRKGVEMLAFRPPGSAEIKHVGGKAGKPLHGEAVEVVRILRQHLNAGIRIIGVGGIFIGEDAFDFIKAGANGFECATAVLEYREDIFSVILVELADCMYPDEEAM